MAYPRRPTGQPRPSKAGAARSTKRLGHASTVAVLLTLSPALAQAAEPHDLARPTRDAGTPPAEESRGADAPRPTGAAAVTITLDAKTTIPESAMREQAGFRLGDVLRRVPGVGVNRR